MNKIFKKALTIAGSALMVGSTIGLAAAAAYPAPFVENGAASVAIVYGSDAAASDKAGATTIQADLASELASQAGSGAVTVSGDAVSLNSGSTKVWLNSSLNSALTTLTKSNLPDVLGDYTFSGNVDSKLTSTITIGSADKVTFAKQPSSSDDPVVGISLNTNKASPLYNATITMPAINFTHADSEGETIKLFGRDFVVSTATTNSSLVLFSSAEETTLSLGGSAPNPSTTVNIDGTTYEVELVTGTSTTATIAVNGDSKEVNEGSSKKIGGIDIAVKSVTESTAIDTITATLLIGSNKITFNDGSQVLTGSGDDPVDGTWVTFAAGVGAEALTSLDVAVYAPDSSNDAILEGQSFEDPVFGSFAVSFTGLSESLDSANRDTIKVDKSGDKGLTLTMTDSDSNTKTFDFVYNISTGPVLGDSNTYRVAVREYANLSENNYTVMGNEDYGHLLQVTRIYNYTGSDYSKDDVAFKDIISGDPYNAEPTSEGTARLTIDGRQYTVTYGGSGDTGTIVVKYPTSDSTSTGTVMFPTIKTKNGALVALYEPQTFDISDIGTTGTETASRTLKFPDGDGYTSFTAVGVQANSSATAWNWTIDSTVIETGIPSTAITGDQSLTVGELTYSINRSATINQTSVYLNNPSTGVQITTPALIVFENKNDSSNYNVIVLDTESNSAGSSTDPLGVNDVYFTSAAFAETLQSDSDVVENLDLYGTLVTEDSNTASQKVVTISYPEDQVYADVYFSAADAVIGGSSELGDVTYMDSESSAYAGKNLVVVGGSAINSVAAELLGGALRGDAFEDATGVGAGEFLIQSFSRSGKTALLVAGYNAADTTKAVTALTNEAIDTTVGKKYVSETVDGTTVVEA